ncbi:MAG: cytochrome c oxidase subunit II [Rhizomicrobium sp.]
MLRKKIYASAIALVGAIALPATTQAAPRPWEMGLQPAATPVMERIEDFHHLVLVIITAICVFVLALLIWIMIRYNKRANPTPSKVSHNTLLEVIWTIVPVIILVVIAIPSFRLLYFEAEIPQPDLTIKAIGKQWYWTYEYPQNGDFQFDSLGLSDDAAAKASEPRLLGVDNPIVVPVNKVVKVVTTGADVIHSWAVPAFGVKMDAIPGRLNATWFKAEREGVYYGECSELCGARHAFMPIEVKVVSAAEFEKWVAAAKKKFAQNGDAAHMTRIAALTK